LREAAQEALALLITAAAAAVANSAPKRMSRHHRWESESIESNVRIAAATV